MVLPLLLLALVIPVVARRLYQYAFPLALLGVASSATASIWALIHVLENGTMRYHLGGWAPPVGIEYVVDLVSAFVTVIVTTVSTLVVIATRRWAIRDAGDRLGSFYGLVMLLLAGLVGIVLTGDLFNLFVFIEISSLAAYALVFMGGRGGMIAGFRYLILGSIGGSLYMLGVGFLYFTTGTLNMAETQEILTQDASARSVQAGAAFIFVGLGMKMALVPMHLWLPDAYTFAPSSVNSLISPVMTKVSAYAMMRMFLSVFPDGYLTDVVPVGDALLVLGLIGIIFGSVVAISQKDIRRMLAYSSISQLGLIAVGIGLGTPLGMVAALLHVMNHAVMKATLFLAAGSIRYSTGITTVDGVSGLGRTMPFTMIAFTLGAIAMVGIPPMAGFFSKWYAVQAGVESGQWSVVAVVLVSSLLSAVYLFRILERAYLHPVQPEPSHGHEEDTAFGETAGQIAIEEPAKESPLDMVLPTVFLGLATLALGIANVWIVTKILEPGV
jgi:multicomponent Na+:H+ antiporter subunit D